MTSDTIGVAVHRHFMSAARVSAHGRAAFSEVVDRNASARDADEWSREELQAALADLLQRLGHGDGSVGVAVPVWCRSEEVPSDIPAWWSGLADIVPDAESASEATTLWSDVVSQFLGDVVPDGSRIAAVDWGTTSYEVTHGRVTPVDVGTGLGVLDSFVVRFADQYLKDSGAIDHSRLMAALEDERPGSGGVVYGLPPTGLLGTAALTGLSYHTSIEQVLGAVVSGLALSVAQTTARPAPAGELLLWSTHPLGALLGRLVAGFLGRPVSLASAKGSHGLAVAAFAAKQRGCPVDPAELRREWVVAKIHPDVKRHEDHEFCRSVGHMVTNLVGEKLRGASR